MEDCLEYDGIFGAATVLTDHKPNRDCFVAPEQWKWKRQQISIAIITHSRRAEKAHNLHRRKIALLLVGSTSTTTDFEHSRQRNFSRSDKHAVICASTPCLPLNLTPTAPP